MNPELLALLATARRGGVVERLALADWLEEHGQDHEMARSQLIRLQVAIEEIASEKGTNQPERLSKLHEQYGQIWNDWRGKTLAYNARHGSPPETLEQCWLAVPTIELPIADTAKMTFAWVPPGQSWLGGGNVGEEGDVRGYPEPGHRPFTLEKGLWCGIYPVTQAQWQAVMGNNPSHFKENPNHPVELVSWDEVQEFLTKVNQQKSAGGFMYRLPTEEEWEYICRGGPISQADSAFDFTFATSKTNLTPVRSNDLSSHQANFDGNHPGGNAREGPYLQRTSRVGSYLPNPLGIYDMHGNVYEWTSTSGSSHRVIRGGGWYYFGLLCTAAIRYWYDPGYRDYSLGFRLLAVPVEG